MKKVVAILLAITLMSALFIVPAHAHEADEVTPRAMLCDDPGGCNQAMVYRSKSVGSTTSIEPSCPNHIGSHTHLHITYLRYYTCVNSNCAYYNDPVDASYYTVETCNP